MYEFLEKRWVLDSRESKPGAFLFALSWTTEQLTTPSNLWGWARAWLCGSWSPLPAISRCCLTLPLGLESQLCRHRYYYQAAKITISHSTQTFSLFPWSLASLTNGWKLPVGSKAQLSFKDNEKMKGDIQNLLVSTAVAQVEFGPVDLFLLYWALPLCCMTWRHFFRWTALLQGWLSNYGIGPGGEIGEDFSCYFL